MAVLKCVWLGDSPGAELWVLSFPVHLKAHLLSAFSRGFLVFQTSSLVDSSQDGFYTWILCLTSSSLSPEGFMPVRFTGDL